MKKSILFLLILFSLVANAETKQETAGFKNALIWNTLYMSQGVFSFTYEHYFTPSSAIQLGVGVTQENYAKYMDVEFDYSAPVISTTVSNDRYTGGFSGLIGYKKFLRNTTRSKGFYYNPQYRFRNYNYTTNYQANFLDYENSVEIKRYENINEIGCTFGYQTGGYIMFNFYVGGAYMIKQYQDVNTTFSYALDSENFPISDYTYQTKKKSSVSPVPWAGLSIGFMF